MWFFFLRYHKLVGKVRIFLYDPGTMSAIKNNTTTRAPYTIYQNENSHDFKDLSIKTNKKLEGKNRKCLSELRMENFLNKTEQGFPSDSVVKNHLPVQGTWVWSLILEDPTCWGATRCTRHNYRACALEPGSRSYWSPPALGPTLCNRRSLCTTARQRPTHRS